MGYADIEGKKYALLEEAQGSAGEFVELGSEYRGGRLKGIDGKTISHEDHGQMRTKSINNSYSLTPLAKSAKYDNGQIVTDRMGVIARYTMDVDNFLTNPVSPGITEAKAKHLQEQIFEGKISATDAQKQGLHNVAPTGGYLNFLSNKSQYLSVITDFKANSVSGEAAIVILDNANGINRIDATINSVKNK